MPCPSAAKRQVANQLTGVDQPLAEQLVKAIGERLLTQQPVLVRHVQRARDLLLRRSATQHLGDCVTAHDDLRHARWCFQVDRMARVRHDDHPGLQDPCRHLLRDLPKLLIAFAGH